MGKGDPLCAAPPPEHLTQVHRHHAEDVAVAVVEHVDVVEAREKRYKNSVLPPTVLVPCVANVEALCVANVEAPNANDVGAGWRVGQHRSSWISRKAFSC